ncbi:MAG: metal-dependent hydrolase [Candidatus Hodarchaeota archaeon]
MKKFDPIGHFEWTVGIILLIYAVLGIPLSPLELFIVALAADLPDFWDVLLSSRQTFASRHRVSSHTIFFVGGLFLVGFILPIFFLISLASFLHICEDVIAGTDPVFFFSPLTRRFGFTLVNKERSIKLGRIAKRLLDPLFIGTDSIHEELAWFWALVIVGTVVLIAGLTVYMIQLGLL